MMSYLSSAIASMHRQQHSQAKISAENAVLRQALEWYRDKARDCRKLSSEGEAARNELDRDGGRIADLALKGDLVINARTSK